MRVLKSKVALLSLAVAGVFAAANASAAVLNVAATCGASLEKFAVELPPAAAVGAGAVAHTVTSALGFGVATGQRRFVRYDLAPGAKFSAAFVAAGAVTGLPAFNSVATLVQGGATGDTFAVYEIEGGAGNTAATVVSLALAAGAITLPAASSASQTIAYSLHETAVSAVSTSPAFNTTRLSSTGPCAMFEFVKSYDFAIANVNETVDAVAGFKKFTTAPDTVLDIGASVNWALVAAPPLVAATGITVKPTDLFAAGTTIVVNTSDAAGFGALATAGKFWQSGAVCNATIGAPLATTRTASSATFGLTVNPAAGAPGLSISSTMPTGATFLCGIVDGVAIIPPQNLTARIIPAAGSGVGIAPIVISNNVTTIVQNGAQLQSPWFSINPAVASFFFLTNTSSLDMGYTSTVYCENLNTCTPGTGATGTIPAGKSIRVDATGAAGVLASTSGPTRASVLFNIVGATGSVQGDLVTVNPNGANQTTSSHLIRPGTN